MVIHRSKRSAIDRDSTAVVAEGFVVEFICAVVLRINGYPYGWN